MKSFIAIIFICLSGVCYSQSNVKFVSNAVGLLSYQDKIGDLHIGTGTLVAKRLPSGAERIYIVTCKHVLPTYAENRFVQFQIKDSSSKNAKFSTAKVEIWDSIGKLVRNVLLDSSGLDIAAINVSKSFELAGLTHLLSKSIPTDFFADVDTLSAQSVQIGSDVLFMGYPNFYFDQRNISPILRSGIIATDPQEDFYLNDTLRIANNKKYGFALPKIFPGFLIDGNVFGGSSGSLVFTKPRSSKIEDDGFPVFIISDIPYILGILSDSYFSFEMPQKINLGGVISIKYLIKLLQ